MSPEEDLISKRRELLSRTGVVVTYMFGGVLQLLYKHLVI